MRARSASGAYNWAPQPRHVNMNPHSRRFSTRGLFALGLAALLCAIGCGRDKTTSVPESAPVARPTTITNADNLVMALIPGGEFVMGDNDGDADEKPAHSVQVSAFYIDTHEVTQKSYQSLMEKNPSKFKAPDNPVDQVDWYHAVLYCNMRSHKEGLTPCYDPKTLACDFTATGYRLPTEAEWEYACRAGPRDKYYAGNASARLKTCAWFKENANQTTHPVGQKTPNAWGLYDMLGNVAEWCNDTYDENYYQQKAAQNPHGPPPGERRVLRGGSWAGSADACRSSARNSETPRLADACFGSDTYGFRCVRRP
jgi:formylglycine-generating enzyme required for sulfatase activity